MNMVLKLLLSMSCSGALLILVLLLGKRFLKDKISRQWQYYIWLIVIMRFLLPFGTEINLMGKTYRAIDQVVTQEAALPQQQSPATVQDSASVAGSGLENVVPAEASTAAHPFRDAISLLVSHIWLIWLAVALGMLIQKITVYQSFVRYINSGSTPVSDIDILDQLAITAEQMGIKKPVELCANPQISSPLLKGAFHPCIVLPSVDIPEKDFRYIILHELTHYKRKDMFYKWLVQATVCLHWFNPLVQLMGREITKACEFSCDEAVLAQIGYDNAQAYGKTLLDAMAAVGRYKESLGAATLSENKRILKERLGAIMMCKRKSKAVRLLTGILTLCIIFGAAFIGVYPADAADTVSEKTLPEVSMPEYVEVDFSGISITGQGPVGVELVRTDETGVSFEYLNMDYQKKCTASAKVVDGIMKIEISYAALDSVNLDFGDDPKNVVRVYIPDAVYTRFDITTKQMVLHMQDFNAPVHVTSEQAGFSLIDTDILRGTYDIDVTSGPVYIEADTILNDITANVNNGPLNVCFNKEPVNLYLDTTNCGPGWVERPADWPAVYRVGNENPKLILSNYGPATIEVADK